MPDEHAHAGGSEPYRRFNILRTRGEYGRRSCDTRQIQSVGESACGHNHRRRGAERHGQHQCDQHGRYRDQRIDHHHRRGSQHGVARHHGGHQCQAEYAGHGNGQQCDRKIRARSGHQPAQHIGADAIRPQRVRGRGRGPCVESVGLQQRMRRPYERNQRNQHPQAEHGQRIFAAGFAPYRAHNHTSSGHHSTSCKSVEAFFSLGSSA